MRAGAIIELTRADPKHPCAYVGQTAKVWRVNTDGSIYVELKCGHPYVIAMREHDGYFKILSEPVEETKAVQEVKQEVKKEKPMPRGKRSLVKTDAQNQNPQIVSSDSRTIVPVQGYDAEVQKHKTNAAFLKQLEQQVAEGKTRFRNLAAQVVANSNANVSRVEFLAADGSAVHVAIPDASKAGNRKLVDAEDVAAMEKLGLDPAKATSTDTVFVLSGDFVPWFRKTLADNYTSKGIAVPEGVEEQSATRMTEEAIVHVKALLKADPNNEAAKYLLASCVKAEQVTVK